MVGEVNDTETRVTGLTPGVFYTISVSSENNVSSQDNNINDRSASISIITKEGGEYKLLESEKYANACSMPVDRGILRSFISMTHLIHSWRCGEGVFSGAGWVVELVSSSSS